MADKEENSLGGRVRRYAKVGRAMAGIGARMAGSRYLGLELDRGKHAAELKAALRLCHAPFDYALRAPLRTNDSVGPIQCLRLPRSRR